MKAAKVERVKLQKKQTMIAQNRGLHYEENLLWEKEQSDSCGVDLPAPMGMKSRTGVEERGDVGHSQRISQ